MSLGNGYSIDMSDGWTFVHALQDAERQLTDALLEHGQNLTVPPPGRDAHSQRFSQTMMRALDAHNQWASQQQQHLQSMINSATAMLKQYGVAETDNTIQWGDPGGSTPSTSQRGGARAV